MAGNIFLGGGGDEQQSRQLDDVLIGQFKKGYKPSCLYVPIAMIEKHHESAQKWFRDSFGDRFGIVKMIGRLSELPGDVKFDVVFMGGGNTGKLLDQIYGNAFDGYLRRQLEEGRIVYGGSAGAVVLGSTILTAPMREHTARNEGLNLVGGAAVMPHYKEYTDRSIVADKSARLGCKVLAIPEDAGVIIYGNGDMKAVGRSHAYAFEPNGNVHPLARA